MPGVPNSELEWLFEATSLAQLDPCVAFRASTYVSRLSASPTGREVIDRCNSAFCCVKRSYRGGRGSRISPFVTHSLFLSVKIETRYWDACPDILRYAVGHHFAMLEHTHPSAESQLLMDVDVLIADALDWRLMPTSPFQCLQELGELGLVPRLDEAKELCRLAIVCELDLGNAYNAAAAAAVAVETMHGGLEEEEVELLRLMNALVIMVAKPERFDVFIHDVISTSKRLEALAEERRFSEDHTSPEHLRKRLRPALESESPVSVIL